MKQLREQIKKEIKSLMEANYPAPPEIISALKKDLKLNPLIRYVRELKAANTVPPSYEVRLLNGTSFMIYLEEYSLMVKIGAKKYYIGDGGELNLAKTHINKLLTKPIFNPNAGEETEAEPTGGATGGTPPAGGGEEDADVAMEPDEEEPEDELPEDEITT